MHFQVAIIGAGPAGLACARILSQSGIRTLIVEKKETIGPKVCAGGLTWNGLAGIIPEDLIEKSFPVQHISTRFQNISVRSPHPIIVTVNRKKLGQFMLKEAIAYGAEILPATRVIKISDHDIILLQNHSSQQRQVHFNYLVGADGSNSFVRKHLALPTSMMGIGINFQIPGDMDKMEWHLNVPSFKNGYGWIFPHRDTVSVGAYADKSVMKALDLKSNLIGWAKSQGISLANRKCSAEYVNFDYKGWDFGNIFLAGDAAGLASALTGEGIYPAIVSGETVARKIINPSCDLTSLTRIIKKQKFHTRVLHLTGKNRFMCTILHEFMVFLLRKGILDFRHLEMTD